MTEKTGNVKLGAAVVGGYVLGRTKKGMLALRIAMYLSGDQGGPAQKVIGSARRGVVTMAQSAEAQELVEQVKGPLLEALQNAALATVTSRMNRVTSGLNNRAQQLTSSANEVVEGTVGTVGDAATDTTDAVKDTGKKLGGLFGRRKKDDEQEDGEAPESQEDSDNEESEPEEDNESDEGEDQGDQDEEGSEEEEPEPEPEPEPKPRQQAGRRPHRRTTGARSDG